MQFFIDSITVINTHYTNKMVTTLIQSQYLTPRITQSKSKENMDHSSASGGSSPTARQFIPKPRRTCVPLCAAWR